MKRNDHSAQQWAEAAAAMVGSGNRHRQKQQDAQQQGGKDYISPYKAEERGPSWMTLSSEEN